MAYFCFKITVLRYSTAYDTQNMPSIIAPWLLPPKTGTNHHTVHLLLQQEVRSDIPKVSPDITFSLVFII